MVKVLSLLINYMQMPIINANSDSRKKHQLPLCPVCDHEFKSRVKRGRAVKFFLFWYPVKRYFCSTCLECHYVFKPKYSE